MPVRLKLGDLFQIPLENGTFTYCQLIARNDQLGFLVQVFNFFDKGEAINLSAIYSAPLQFPPVFVGVQATARSGRWKRLGNFGFTLLSFPRFRNTFGTKPGEHAIWFIWDGTTTTRIGRLPKELRSLELECVWGDEALEERILAGTYRGDRMT